MCMGVTAGAYILTLFAVSDLVLYSAYFSSSYHITVFWILKDNFDVFILTPGNS